MARRILTDGGPEVRGGRWEPSLIPDTVQGSASSLRTTEQCSRQADTHRKCVMKRPMNISVGNMLVTLKLSSVILLLNIVSTISSLSLTAIEVPKYAKVNVRCQCPVCHLPPGRGAAPAGLQLHSGRGPAVQCQVVQG